MVPLDMDAFQPPPPLVVPQRSVRDRRTRNVFFLTCSIYFAYGIYLIAANLGKSPEASRVQCEAALNAVRRLDDLGAVQVRAGQTVFGMLEHHWAVVLASAGAGIGAVLLWLTVLKKYSLQATYVSIALYAMLLSFSGVCLLSYSSSQETGTESDKVQAQVLGVACLVLGLLAVVFMVKGKQRIAVTANMISWSTEAVETFPLVFAYFVGIVLGLILLFVFFAVVMVAYEASGEFVLNEELRQCELQFPVFPAIFFPLVSLWILYFARVARTSMIAGTTAIWYFHKDNIESFGNPVAKSARWAVVEAAGSNALAALVVAVCDMLNALARRRRRAGCLQLVAMCLLECLRELIKLFTKFAVIVVAITGESFVDAGKISYGLLRRVFVDGFVTDRLARVVLSLTGIMLSYSLYLLDLSLVGVPAPYSFSAGPFFAVFIILCVPYLGGLRCRGMMELYCVTQRHRDSWACVGRILAW